MPLSKIYLGDAVYAEILPAKGQIKLTTEDGIDILNEIYFDAETLNNFLIWLDSFGIKMEK